MKKWLWLGLFMLCATARGQGWDYFYRLNSAFVPLNGGNPIKAVAPYSGTPVLGDIIYFNGTNWVSLGIGSSNQVLTVSAGLPSWQAAAGGGANANGTYLVETATNAPVNAFVMGTLGTGLVINTTTTGVPTIMSAQSCTNQFVRSYSASGQATCSSVLNGDISSTMIQAATDGGAVAAQSATPGTQQGSGGNKNFNLNGKGILELDSLTTTPTDALLLQNTTASSGGTTVQVAPSYNQCGTAWNSSGAQSETDCWRLRSHPNTVAGTTTDSLFLDVSINGGAYVNAFNLSSAGTGTFVGAGAFTGNVAVSNAANQFQQNATANGTGGFFTQGTNGSTALITAKTFATTACSGSTTCTTAATFPANSVILGIGVRLTVAITGATTWEIGTANNASAFCSGITTVAINSTFACGGGVTGATGQSATGTTAIVFTSTVGGNFTAGTIEVEAYYIIVTPPTS